MATPHATHVGLTGPAPGALGPIETPQRHQLVCVQDEVFRGVWFGWVGGLLGIW